MTKVIIVSFIPHEKYVSVLQGYSLHVWTFV